MVLRQIRKTPLTPLVVLPPVRAPKAIFIVLPPKTIFPQTLPFVLLVGGVGGKAPQVVLQPARPPKDPPPQHLVKHLLAPAPKPPSGPSPGHLFLPQPQVEKSKRSISEVEDAPWRKQQDLK